MADTKRRNAFLALLLLLAMAVIWGLTRKAEAPRSTPPEPSTATAPRPRSGAADAGPADAQRAQAAPTPVLKLPSARRTEAPEGAPGPFSGRVVSAVNGQGIPGAELTFRGPSYAVGVSTARYLFGAE